MASLKNSPGQYCLEQKAFKHQVQYREYTHSQVPVSSKLPGLGINVGNMRGGYFNNVLSNNASNIESHLYGIKQIDLTKILKDYDVKEFESKYIKKKTFYLGTDKYGRDMLSRMIIGSRVSISIGFVAVIISLIIGILIGLTSGYFGGLFDDFIVWLINVFWAIPTLLLVIAITISLGKGYWQVFFAVGLTMWVEVARLVRGQVRTLKEKLFIQSAKVLGFSSYRIMLNHILPNLLGPLIVISAANFASAILIESGLSFLGIGVQPPVPSWGGMVKDHFRYIILGKEYLAILPGLAIMSLVLSFMILGNSLRDAFDVRN